MYWLVIATLYGALAGHVVGFVFAAANHGVRGVDEGTWQLIALAGAAIGLVFGLLLENLARAEGWPVNKGTLIKSIVVFAVLALLWTILYPAIHAVRE
jgi:hypothetical protein